MATWYWSSLVANTELYIHERKASPAESFVIPAKTLHELPFIGA